VLRAPSAAPILPLSSFLETKKKRQAFESLAGKLGTPAVPATVRKPALEVRRKALANNHLALTQKTGTLRMKLTRDLGAVGNTAAKETALKNFQGTRTVLEAKFNITDPSEKLERQKLESMLKTHRIEAQEKVVLYDDLRKEMNALMLGIDAQNKAVADLIKADNA